MIDTQSNGRGQTAILSQLTLRRQLRTAVLVVAAISILFEGSATVLGQPQDVVNDDKSKAVDHTRVQDNDKDIKPEKRGSLVIAPIPISSPAFGSGLLIISGYVFKFNESDKTSPPSWVGAAGAFTNNGSRALALGGRLYLSENKYQTTVAAIKGRANLDFFGIGRIPGRSAISVPLEMEGTIFFGELLRNIGRNIFVGPRYQYRRLKHRTKKVVS